jgi:hypothetical protein
MHDLKFSRPYFRMGKMIEAISSSETSLDFYRTTRSQYNDWVRAGRPRNQSLSPDRIKNCLLSRSSKPGSWIHVASYPVGTGSISSGGKATGV